MNLKSMTAFGAATEQTPLGICTVEISTVNKRHLEMQCYLPSQFSRFDTNIRSYLSKFIFRGQVSLRLNMRSIENPFSTITPNLSLLKQLKNAWTQIATELGHPVDKPLPLELFANQVNLIESSASAMDDADLWQIIENVLRQAIEKLLAVKLKEGLALQKDILQRVNFIRTHLQDIELRSSDATKKFRLKLKERLDEVLNNSAETDERIMREVCVYAEKIDITEECVRLKTHLIELERLISCAQPYVGKQLEFLVQEITREISTLNAKSSEIDVIQLALSMKNEVERIREQIQNIE